MHAGAIQKRGSGGGESQERALLISVGVAGNRLGQGAGEFSDFSFERLFIRAEQGNRVVSLEPELAAEIAPERLADDVAFADHSQKLPHGHRQLMGRKLLDHPAGLREKRE